jgi:hypothetical protein
MISQNYPVIAKHATLTAPTAPARTVVPETIELDNGQAVKVAYDRNTGCVSRWNVKKKTFEFFRSLEEATTELNLEAMGLTKTSITLTYRGSTIVMFGSVFSQAPQQVRDEYLRDDCFLKTDNSFLWYFAFADEYGTQWYSHELKDACRCIFTTLVDLEIDPYSGIDF